MPFFPSDTRVKARSRHSSPTPIDKFSISSNPPNPSANRKVNSPKPKPTRQVRDQRGDFVSQFGNGRRNDLELFDFEVVDNSDTMPQKPRGNDGYRKPDLPRNGSKSDQRAEQYPQQFEPAQLPALLANTMNLTAPRDLPPIYQYC